MILTGALLNVKLDGDAKLAQTGKEGYYTLNSILVNGRRNWIQYQGSNAIWYDDYHKTWNIGVKQNLGTSSCSIYSTNDAAIPEEATTWMVLNIDNGSWTTTTKVFGSISKC